MKKGRKLLSLIMAVLMMLLSVSIGNNQLIADAATISLNRPLDKDYPITAREYYSGGSYHGALDYGVPKFTPVYAAESGVIYVHDGGYGDGYLGCQDGYTYGNYATISHYDGWVTYYAHMSAGKFVVKSGDSVKRGQLIGYSGNSGSSTGPHLHFELRLNNNKVYVEPYIKTASGYYTSPSTDTQKPIISGVAITDVDSTGYTITCNVSDNKGVTRVSFPTWTNYNGQDDIRWLDGTIRGNTVSFRVNKSDHNNENGTYTTDIYAYDEAGNFGAVYGYICFVDAVADMEITYNGTKYILYKAKVCYEDAEKYCRNKGGYLAKITSAGENQAIGQMVTKYLSWCWINGSDAETEGAWKFSDGTKMTYFNWAAGEPNSYMGTDQDYIAMHPGNGEWDDSTGLGYGFICEFDHTHSYSSKVTKNATCTSTGVKTFTCSCGKSYTETIAKTSHNSNTTIPAVASTCTKTGLTAGKKCSACGTVTVAQQTTEKAPHPDTNNDKICDVCSEVLGTITPNTPEEPSTDCSCSCHKGGISGFFFKLILFFQRIFGMNKECKCGAMHY